MTLETNVFGSVSETTISIAHRNRGLYNVVYHLFQKMRHSGISFIVLERITILIIQPNFSDYFFIISPKSINLKILKLYLIGFKKCRIP